MADIVERLRFRFTDPAKVRGTLVNPDGPEAADEIERLLTAKGNLRMEITALLHIADRDEAEIERLRIKVYQLENDLALTRAMLPTGYKYEVVRIEND